MHDLKAKSETLKLIIVIVFVFLQPGKNRINRHWDSLNNLLAIFCTTICHTVPLPVRSITTITFSFQISLLQNNRVI